MNMNNMVRELFGPIQADEALKNRTQAFLAVKTQGYTKMKAEHHPLYAAACACLLFVLLGGHWIYFTPVAQISIDINPSVEMSVNRFDRVISISGFNEDGQELSNALDVKYRNYTDAIEQILKHDTIAALLADNEVMTITVVGPGGQRGTKILSEVEKCAAEQRNTYCYFASLEEVAPAHEMGFSCGKYRAFLELRCLDPSITPEMAQGMTMREIRELIDSLSTDGEDNTASYNNWGSGHHGYGGSYGRGYR